MKKIYVIMVELPTVANKIVYFLSGFEYSHISISLDDNFKKLYAFQVRNKKTSLVGGFMEEDESFYFHGKKNIQLKEMIFEISVTDEKYLEISNYINSIKNDNEYIFNYVSGLFMFLLGGIKVYKSYHCVEFISEILNMIEEINLTKKVHKMHPKDLYMTLKKFKCTSKIISSSDYVIDNENAFFKKLKMTSIIKKSFYSTTESIIRAVLKRPRKKFDYNMMNFYESDFK